MKLLILALVVTAVFAQNSDYDEQGYIKGGAADSIETMNKYDLTQANALQPEWHIPPAEGNNLLLGGNAGVEVFEGGTTDYKDETINMTPYVRQTKDERWEAGVPNYEAPEEGYFIRTFGNGPMGETAARAWVLDKTASKNTINYPLAPDVDPEENLPNPNNPEDKNPNIMQDDVPTAKPLKQAGHMEPAYVGEYDDKEIFGDVIEGEQEAVRSAAEGGVMHGDTYLQTSSHAWKKMKALRQKQN